jgi:hypothetical protein
MAFLQVSEHTTRVHFHGAADGNQPLGASLPLEALLPACQPSAAAATLLAAVQARPVLKKIMNAAAQYMKILSAGCRQHCSKR